MADLLSRATELLEAFEEWSSLFADGYLDVRFGGSLAADAGYNSLYLETCQFLDKEPSLKAVEEVDGYAVG